MSLLWMYYYHSPTLHKAIHVLCSAVSVYFTCYVHACVSVYVNVNAIGGQRLYIISLKLQVTVSHPGVSDGN